MTVPGQPPPYVPPPPPAPPPAASSPWKWILIGCGIVVVIGALFCGGCMLIGWQFAKSMMTAMEDTKRLVEADPDVRLRCGTVTVPIQGRQPMQRNNPDQSVTFIFEVQGTKENATAELTVRLSGMGFTADKLEVVYKDGTRHPIALPKK